MAANKGDSHSPEILPHGWTLQFSPLKSGREVKCYVNSGTGKKFFSKDDLIRHIKAEKVRLNLRQPMKSPVKSPSGNNQMCLIEYTNERPEWLPHNWTVELKTKPSGKKYKCFVEPMTGNKFYSKPQVFQHLKIVERKKCSLKLKETLPILIPLPSNEISLHDHDAKCFAEPTANEFDSKPHAFQDLKIMDQEKCSLKRKETLPTLLPLPSNEISLHDHDAKSFAEPTVNEFYSKPQAFQDLKIMEPEKCSLTQKESLPNLLPLPANEISLRDHDAKVCVERSPAEDLPTGWIREIRIQRKAKGVRKDPFYIDPISGYAFHSKRDAQRYIESGDVKSCKILPKKRDIDDEYSLSSAAKNQKVEHHASRQELIGQGNSDGNSIASSEVDSLREREGLPASPSTIDRKNVASLEADSSRGNEDKTAIVLATVAGTTFTEISSQKIPSDNDEKNCILNQSAPTSCEVSDTNQVKNETVTFQDNKKQEQNHESGFKWNESNTTRNSLGKSDHSKVCNMPRRSSKRLAGIEPEIVADSASGIQAISENGNKHTQNSPAGGTKGPKGSIVKAISPPDVGVSEILNYLGHTINENGYNLPHRTTEQITMIEAKPGANTGSIVLALPKTTRSSKSGVILAVGASKGGLTEIPPEHIIDEGKKELVLHASTNSISPLVIEPLNKHQKSDTGCSVQSKAKSIIVSTDDEFVSTPKVVNLKDKKSLESGSVRKDQRPTQNNLSSRNRKTFKLVGPTSKRSADFEPELVSSSKSIAQGIQNPKRSCRIKSTETKLSISDGLAQIVSQQPKDRSRVELPRGLANEHNLLQGEQLNKNQVFLVGKTAEDQSRSLEEISESSVRAPQNTRSHITEPTEAVCLTSYDLPNIESQYINNEQKMELQYALTTSSNSSYGVDLKKKHAFLHDQTVPTEPMLVLESDVEKTESTLIPPFQEFFSDPCLEFAYKTLTGEIPVEITAKNGMISAPVSPVMDEKMKRTDKFCNGKTLIKSRTYKTSAKLHLPHEPPESVKNSTARASSYKRSYISRPRKSNIIEASADQLKPIPEAECAYYDFANAQVMRQHGSLNNVIQHTNEVCEDNKPELTPLFSYGEYWSDPCLEFAYKTLTGALPVEDNLPVQNYFQQQVDTSQTQKEGSFQQVGNTFHTPRDGSLSLPDFGLPSFFQTDISVHFDALDNQLATQPQVPPNNPPFIPSGSATLPSYSGIGSQQQAHLFSPSCSSINSQQQVHLFSPSCSSINSQQQVHLFSPSCSSIGSEPQVHLNENKVLPGKFNL